MTTARRLALRMSNAVVRLAPPGAENWAKAMLCELDFIESDWTALLWALGGTLILFRFKSCRKPREIPLTGIDDIHGAAKTLTHKVRARTLSVLVTIGESVAFGCLLFLVANPIQKLGSFFTVVAMLYMTYQLLARRVGEGPGESDLSRCAVRYRADWSGNATFTTDGGYGRGWRSCFPA
jgi:hypothetical protein